MKVIEFCLLVFSDMKYSCLFFPLNVSSYEKKKIREKKKEVLGKEKERNRDD